MPEDAAMDLDQLHYLHQSALVDLEHSDTHDARRWAADRADYYADQIVEKRMQQGIPSAGFDARWLG